VKVHPTIVKTRNFGEFDILFQYVDEEPALVIRANRFLNVRRRAYVIKLESAWKYVDDVFSPHSGHSQYMVKASSVIQEMLGLSDSVDTRFRIAEGILDCLEDLINMTPFKQEDKPVYADVKGTLTVGDEKFDIEVEVDGDAINNTDGYQQVDTPLELQRGDL
jgi:hypothetical protein